MKKSVSRSNYYKYLPVSLSIVIFLVVALIFQSTAVAQGLGPELFSEVPIIDVQSSESNESFILRSRFVEVNLDVLKSADGKPLTRDKVDEVVFNLFPDATYNGVIETIAVSGNDASIQGSIAEVEGGYFYIELVGDTFLAHVASTAGVYEVSSMGDGIYKIIQIDHSQLVDCPDADMPDEGLPIQAEDLGVNADSGSTIDVMVVYTPAALAGEGSEAAMKARVALAVSETNTSYSKAGITTRLRLVHTEMVSYTETGNMSTDLNRMINTSDGYMDNVHSLRNIYGADMVSLVVENGGGYCGLASSIKANATNAFQVTKRYGCMTGYYSFGHEFGHLQGARHDTYVDSSTSPYTYGHGYVHKGSTFLTRWRTVMAYNNKCSDSGYNCTRLSYWSNPTKTYLGAAIGNTKAQNYQVLNLTDTAVANFRLKVIGSNFDSSFTSSYSGWTPVVGTWYLSGSNYYVSKGKAFNFATVKHSGKYGDLTYSVKMKRTGCTYCANNIIVRGDASQLKSNSAWSPSYLFEYTNNGSFGVFYIDSSGNTNTLQAWTSSTAIVKDGWNTLKVVAVGPSLKYYINGVLVWSGSHSSLKVGNVGIGFYREDVAPNKGTLYVTSAKLNNTPTADIEPDLVLTPTEAISGGDITKSP